MTSPRSGFDPSRRAALAALGGPAFAAAACGRAPYARSEFRLPPSSPVVVLRAGSYAADLADIVRRGLRELRIDVSGRRVLLKPNLVEFRNDSAVNTDPALVAGAASALLRAGAREVIVGEGPGHRRDIEYLLVSTGMLQAIRAERVRFVDLNHDDVVRVPLRSRFTGMETLALPATLGQADLVVSMPKLKTHHWAGLTASMKNLFGVVPGAVYGWPKNILHVHGIEQSILDLVATVRPGLAIVDGIVAMEGDGPIMGRPRPLGAVVMGTDVVAVDATCARLAGFEPHRIGYLRRASRFLGNVDAERIELRGEPVERLTARLEVLPHWAALREPLPFWVRWFG